MGASLTSFLLSFPALEPIAFLGHASKPRVGAPYLGLLEGLCLHPFFQLPPGFSFAGLVHWAHMLLKHGGWLFLTPHNNYLIFI